MSLPNEIRSKSPSDNQATGGPCYPIICKKMPDDVSSSGARAGSKWAGGRGPCGAKKARRAGRLGPAPLGPSWGGPSCPRSPAPPMWAQSGGPGGKRPSSARPRAFPSVSTTVRGLTSSSPVTKPIRESGFTGSQACWVRVSFRSHLSMLPNSGTRLGVPSCGQVVSDFLPQG